MKKSKIIVPAIAMIGLSAVASITGSVAWFTAQRTGSMTTEDFIVTRVGGDLSVAVNPGVGTTEGTAANSIKAKTFSTIEAKLRDASFDPTSKRVYTARDNGSTFAIVDNSTIHYDTLTEASHPFIANNTDHYYHAFTWKVTLSVSGSSTSSLNVFFDYTNSSMTATDVDGTSSNKSSKGFRIAMMTNSGANTIVYAKLQEAANLEAVSGNTPAESAYTALSGFNYFSSNLYGSAGTPVGSLTNVSAFEANKATDTTADQSSRPDYLGNVTSAASLDVYFVAWYDGCDPNVVNDTVMQKVKSTIAFYSTVVNN